MVSWQSVWGSGCEQDAAGRGAVKLVQVKGPNTDWESMNNVWGASWESTSIPDPPLDFRIQDDSGVEVWLGTLTSSFEM